ncbi:MAG: hypothetical protein GKR91_17450 [Pseudomonadales bacterium]|nr:hypothetical protein [Pseudomonadales bacterium]
MLLSWQAGAQQLDFLRESVLSSLDERDVTSLRAQIREALDQAPDAEVIDWNSPDGNKAGKILVRFSYETNDRLCRRSLFQVSETNGRRENFRFDLCQTDSGWEIAETPGILSQRDRDQLRAFVVDVLDNQEDGLPLSWSGRRSRNNAVVVPLTTDSDVAENCRLTAITLIDQQGQSLNGQYLFCKNAQGEWEYSPR